MLIILMSVSGPRIDAINGNTINTLRAAETQSYADDSCKQDLKQAIDERKKFAKRTGLLLAKEKCHFFVNTFAHRVHLEGISVSENVLFAKSSFNGQTKIS